MPIVSAGEFLANLATEISGPLIALLVILLAWAKYRVESSMRSVERTVENGIQARLDKIESGVWNVSQRVQTIEEQVMGGAGQHFVPPPPPSGEPERVTGDSPEYVVRGTGSE